MAKQVFHVCHHCSDRTSTCHGTCKKYLDEVKENEMKKKEENKEKEINSTLTSLAYNRNASISQRGNFRKK